MKKYVKIVLPLVLGILITIILWVFKVPSIYIYHVGFVINSIVACTTTLAGFILTSLSIIIGMSSSPIMQKISEERGLPELVWIYSESLVLSLGVIVWFIILGANIDEDNLILSKWLIICAGLLVSYICSMIVTTVYILRIISKIPSKNKITFINKPTAPPGEFR